MTLTEILSVLEFMSEKFSFYTRGAKHICREVPFKLFVYNANESTLAAGALFRKYVSVSKKTDSQLSERRN